MPKLLAEPEWLKVSAAGSVGVDREKNVIRGAILAEEGTFKDRRGVFDRQAIRRSVKLASEKPAGLKSRFTHPGLSSDGLGKFLGRIKNHRSDTVLRETGKDANGRALMQERLVHRGDIHIDKTALDASPDGGKPLGTYVMDLAESDPDALGMSLVLKTDQKPQLDTKTGKPLQDSEGNDLPPIWMPLELHACDCVDDGDATHSMLSADILAGLPDAIVRQGCELLDAQFGGQEREAVKARLSAFVDRYLNLRFPDETEARTFTEDDILTGSGTDLEPLGTTEQIAAIAAAGKQEAHAFDAAALDLYVAIEEASA